MPYYYPVREKVFRYIREKALLHAGDRVAVAVSGGADSVALLRVLLELRSELGIVLAVAHFNHGLRGEESLTDQAFVAELATQHDVDCFVGRADVRGHAFTSKLSIEAAARELRYQWLAEAARNQRFDAIATAHTLDDQAETVLLKFLRGAGTRGLAGIYPVLDRENCRVVRPLLGVSREEVETYLESLGQPWREDETNLDRRYTRNRVRHDLLPLLEREFNPSIRTVLSGVAEVSRAEEEYWQELVERELTSRIRKPDRLMVGDLARLPLALQRRLLRRFAEATGLTLDFEHVEKLLHCALGSPARTDLPGGWLAERKGDYLELQPARTKSGPTSYNFVLPIPGEVPIAELALALRALVVAEEFARELPDGELLSSDLLGPQLTVRNWRPGDRFWPTGHGAEEKLKRLFAEKRIPAEQRPSWPVVLKDDQIVWVRGFPAARAYAWKGSGPAVQIETLEPAVR
ncbi:MAG: tRNA lysidine(34) synthetase TilS [Candidatus Korobacteraceae bacterium]